jgi:hypothetical protein
LVTPNQLLTTYFLAYTFFLVCYSATEQTDCQDMLAASRVSVLTSQVAKQAVRVAGQRKAALTAVRRRGNVSVRSIQSVAQTDRVC